MSETSLRRWTNAGLLACYRIGGRRERRFRRADLMAFLEKHSRAGTASVPASRKGAHESPHICGLYTSDRARVSLTTRFLAEGLSAGSVCFLGATADLRRRVQAALARRREVRREIERARLVLIELEEEAKSQFYAWKTHFEVAMRSGARTLRIVGDVSGARFSRHSSLDEVLEFEAKYDRLLARRFPVSSLCLYDARLLTGIDTARVISAHSDVLSQPVA